MHFLWTQSRAQELCDSRRGRPEPAASHSPYGLCGRKAALEEEEDKSPDLGSCVKVEVDVLDSASRPYGLRERKATLNERQKYRLYHCRREATLVKKKKKKKQKQKTQKKKKNVIKRHRIDRPESVAAASLFL